MYGFLKPRGGLPGRCGEGDERARRSGGLGLLVEQHEDAGDGGRLARAGPAADNGESAQHARCGGEALEVGLVSVEQACQAVGQHTGVDVARGLVAGKEVGGDEALVPPVAVEVERGVDETERSLVCGVLADRDERARGEPVDPGLGVRPRQRLQVGGIVEVGDRGGRDRGEIDADRAEPGCAHGERGCEQRVLVVFSYELRETERDVNVGGGQDSRVVEGAQRAGRAADVARVVHVDVLEQAHVGSAPWSRRSLRASMSGAGGRHAKTPQGCPATRNVSGPVMPRKNR